MPGLRSSGSAASHAVYYIDGEAWTLPSEDAAAISLLCDKDIITRPTWWSSPTGRLPATADPSGQPRLLVLRLSLCNRRAACQGDAPGRTLTPVSCGAQ